MYIYILPCQHGNIDLTPCQYYTMDVIPLSDYLIHKRSGNTMRVIQTAIKNFCTYLNPDNPPQTTQDIEKQAAAGILFYHILYFLP